MTPQAIVDKAKEYAIVKLSEHPYDKGHDGLAIERLRNTTVRYWDNAKEFSGSLRGPDGEKAPPNIRSRYEKKTFGFSDHINNAVNLNGGLLKGDVYAIAMTALHEIAHAARGEDREDFSYLVSGGHDDLWEAYARALGIAPMASGNVKALSHEKDAWRPEAWNMVNNWKDGE